MTSTATPTSAAFTPASFEDVSDFPVVLTAKAVEMVKEAMAAEKLVGWGLRVFVQGGGCGGFQYGLDFDEKSHAGDLETTVGGVKVFVDPMSAMHLEGTTIDYVMGVSGSGFKFNNPNAKTTCGCGSSFSA
ncbi:MAG: iron-sulfur cluster insertion protein ErpA [Deltaproteobacteria bacterium]|nr:iron-sulfur cluster insertion protein ErpA [Deltaproteobacteria bacterium]